MNISQTVVPSLKTVRQAFMVDSQAVQNGGVEVVNVDGILGDVVAVVVRLAVADIRALMPPPAIQMVKQRG